MIPIHSPAPWSIEFDRINDATGKQVAQITPRLTGEQNHKLIAAAPELLEALALIYVNAGESPEWIRARIAPAIAKATGGAA